MAGLGHAEDMTTLIPGPVVLLCDECARSVPLLQTVNCCGMRMCTECEDQHPDCAEALRAYES